MVSTIVINLNDTYRPKISNDPSSTIRREASSIKKRMILNITYACQPVSFQIMDQFEFAQ